MTCDIGYLEHVEVTFNLTYSNGRGNVQLLLESPSGTKTVLVPGRSGDDHTTRFNWTILSVQFWGENPSGGWKISIREAPMSKFSPGTGLFSVFFSVECLPLSSQLTACRPLYPLHHAAWPGTKLSRPAVILHQPASTSLCISADGHIGHGSQAHAHVQEVSRVLTAVDKYIAETFGRTREFHSVVITDRIFFHQPNVLLCHSK